MMKGKSSSSNKYQFYGRRKGPSLSRLRNNLINKLLPEVLINLDTPSLINPPLLFNNNNVWLEIGFGAGEHLAFQAETHPDTGFIGCEPYINGVAKLLSEINQKSLQNIRLYNDDARLLLEKLSPNSIDKVFVLFSDPWPKKRHNRRRFINIENLNSLSRVMKDRAHLRFSTDNMNFARWSLDMFYHHPDFVWLVNGPEDWRDNYCDSVPTRYEKKAISSGQKCVYLTFQRCVRQ